MNESINMPDFNESNSPYYNLENRTYEFAKNVRAFTKKLSRTVENLEDIRQLTKASASTSANYIEANEPLSRKDFLYRIKVCRKEAKESRLFTCLVECGDNLALESERDKLVKEALELVKIFNAIAEKTEANLKS